jgi:propionyl-CoA synthetase
VCLSSTPDGPAAAYSGAVESSPYRDAHARSLADPEGFWLEAAARLQWDVAPDRALDDSGAPFYRWFPDARLNTSVNALDRHVEAGAGERLALVHDSPLSGGSSAFTYAELLAAVARFAGALRGLGVERGDTVVIYMPMVPEAVIAMLACARLGAVHSVVFGGFAAKELALRIDDVRPRVLLTASGGIEPGREVPYRSLVDGALDLTAHRPEQVVFLQRPGRETELREGELDWEQAQRGCEPAAPVAVAATDPLYVLYTSGTTGRPKGIVRDNGGHAVALDWSMREIFDVGPGGVFWAASDIGWVVGHSYIVYGPLIAGATTVLYEGKPVKTPDAGAFGRVIAEHRVGALLTAPTAIRAIAREDPEAALIGAHDLSSLRHLFLAGERLDPDTFAWAGKRFGVPVVDNWWQTETGWPIAANPRGLEPLPIVPGSPSVAMPGYDVRVLDSSGEPVEAGVEGAICLRLPLPPGALPTLWKDDERYLGSYLETFPGHYLSGDGGYLDDDGYLFVMGRTDDVINVAGHRLSTGSIEAALASHPAVAEAAVIGVRDQLKGELPRGIVVLKAGHEDDVEQLRAELIARVREQVGPVASFKQVDVVPALPKTRSGKILRKAMRRICEGHDDPPPATIEDPAVLADLGARLRAG